MFVLVGGLVLILAMLGLLDHLEKKRALVASPSTPRVAVGSARPAPSAPAATPTKPAVDPAVAQLGQTISQALAVLRDPNNPNKKAALTALREALTHADPKVALAAIRQFLAGGENAATSLGFKVGEGGVLDEAPSLRTFLMDQLGTISRAAGTNDAAEEARVTLQAANSPDESALAMRNLAWADPQGSKSLLAASERAMLDNAAWRQSPTGGYLEAFDVAAYVGDASLLDELAAMAKTPSPCSGPRSSPCNASAPWPPDKWPITSTPTPICSPTGRCCGRITWAASICPIPHNALRPRLISNARM